MVDGLCKTDVVRNLVDEACRPFEMFRPPELGLDDDSVEERSPVSEDGPRDASAYICREGVADDVHLLLIKGFRDLEEAFVVVAFVPEEGPNECAKRVDT